MNFSIFTVCSLAMLLLPLQRYAAKRTAWTVFRSPAKAVYIVALCMLTLFDASSPRDLSMLKVVDDDGQQQQQKPI